MTATDAVLVPVVSRRVLIVAAVAAAAAAGVLVVDSPAVGGLAVLGAVSLGVWARRLAALLPAAAVVLLYANVPVLLAEQLDVPAILGALVVPGLLALSAVVHARRDGVWLVVPSTTPWMLLLLGATALAAVLSPLPGGTVDTLVTFATEGVLLWFLVVQAIRDEEGLRLAATALVATAALLALVSVVQTVTASYDTDFLGFAQHDVEDPVAFAEDADGRPARVAGPIGEKNRYGQVLLMVVPLAVLGSVRAIRPGFRVVAGLAAVLCLVGVALTASRGAAVAAVLLLLTMVAVRELRGRVLLGALVATLAVVLVLPGYADRLVGTVAALVSDDAVEQVDGAVQGRLASNVGSLRVFLDHPTTGVGPGMYPEFHKRAVEDLGLRVVPRREPHNLYLGLGAETGMIGLLAFLALMGATLAAGWRVRRHHLRDTTTHLVATGLVLGLAAYLYAGLFLHLSFARYLWLMVGLTTAAETITLARPSPGRPSA